MKKDEKKKIKRRVKFVNGYIVNHPHSAANIFYALFTLLVVAIPVATLFVPVIIMGDGTNVTGLEFAKSLFTGFKLTDDGLGGLYKFANYCTAAGGNLQTCSKYLIMIQGSLWGAMVLMGVIAFILCIVNLCKGYLNKSKAPKSVCGWMFTFALLFSLSFLVYFIIEKIDKGASDLVVWYSFIPCGAALIFLIPIGIIYSNNFEESVLEKDVVYVEDKSEAKHEQQPIIIPMNEAPREKEIVQMVTKVNHIDKVRYVEATTLPNNLTSIGGHAYSQNQSLRVANIPVGITYLGTGAFANCLRLRTVTIPLSVKSIGANCFFNCVRLERINFVGTKEQWRKITRGSNWLTKAKTSQVVCKDGILVVNPYQ